MASAAVTRRPPGIAFAADPPRSPDVLPRMDVAGFVGFAASGPVDVPVPVEDSSQFASVFGGELPLAWDAAHGAPATAQLAPAVHAFFRNGGRRAWIVRVAGEDAERTAFPVPGLVASSGGRLSAAVLPARSVGSWADGIRVQTALTVKPAVVATASASRLQFRLEVGSGDTIVPHDLLRVRDGNHMLLVAVQSVEPAVAVRGAGPRDRGAVVLKVTGSRRSALWVERLEDVARLSGARGEARLVGDDGRAHLAPATVTDRTTPDRVEVDVAAPPSAAPAPGSLVSVSGFGASLPRQLFVLADHVHPRGSGFTVSGRPFWILRRPPQPLPRFATDAVAVERLFVELRVHLDDDMWTLNDLGLVPGHPRYLGDLPTDEELYDRHEGEVDPLPAPAVWGDASRPRFPLAGRDVATPVVYYPLGILADFGARLGAEQRASSALSRDGLARFDDSLFLDPALRARRTDTLLTTAEYVRWQAPRPRPLSGIHALLGLEEVTVVSVPDAIQRGWVRSDPELAPDAPPSDSVPAPRIRGAGRACTATLAHTTPSAAGAFRLTWPASGEGAEYVVQETTDPGDWTRARIVHTGADPSFDVPARPPGTYAYRVQVGGEWSEADIVVVPAGAEFTDCAWRVLEPAPTIAPVTPDAGGSYRVTWSETAEPDARYVLQESTDPRNWDTAVTIYEGRATSYDLVARPRGTYVYRVRVEAAGNVSEWSAGRVVDIAAPRQWQAQPEDAYEPHVLLAVQRALLRMCAARGDMLAVLSVPQHYRVDAAVAHSAALHAPRDPRRVGVASSQRLDPVEPLDASETAALAHGALYHPWLTATLRNAPDRFLRTPPDGAAAGVLAERAATRGAWVAPANVVLRDVVTLEPFVDRRAYGALLQAQVNEVRQEADGFLWLSQDTLARDPDVRPVNVVRLLALLRRLALLRGVDYVFEPNDAVFRRSVQRGFEATLTRLFVLGAFAGATPDEAFRVEIGSPPNTPQTLDAGQLIVDLKVAPSRPLAFLTVRLIGEADSGFRVDTR